MAGRGRGRGGVAQFQRIILDLQRQIEELNERFDDQRARNNNVLEEATDEGDNERMEGDEENEAEELAHMSYEDRVLRALEGKNDGIKIEVSDYAGSLKAEELIDWLNEMSKFFDWKPMTEEKKMKFACTKLKGHAMIWWDHLQKERVKKNKDKIKKWSKMEKKLREKFLPIDYSQTLFRKFQNLKQNLSSVQEYTNEFYKLSMRIEHQEDDEQMAARYINGLKFTIQDELSMHRVNSMEEAYQLALKAEEKQNRQYNQRNRGDRRGASTPFRGGSNNGRGENFQSFEKNIDTRQDPPNQERGRGFQRGRGYGSGRGWENQRRPFTCFRCGEEGHRAFECSNFNMQDRNQGGPSRVNLAQADNESEQEVPPDMGENLMMRRTMIIPAKEDVKEKGNDDSWLRTNIFRTRCTSRGKVCQVIVDGGSF